MWGLCYRGAGAVASLGQCLGVACVYCGVLVCLLVWCVALCAACAMSHDSMLRSGVCPSIRHLPEADVAHVGIQAWSIEPRNPIISVRCNIVTIRNYTILKNPVCANPYLVIV